MFFEILFLQALLYQTKSECVAKECLNGGIFSFDLCRCECYFGYSGDNCEQIDCSTQAASCGISLGPDLCILEEIRNYCPLMCNSDICKCGFNGCINNGTFDLSNCNCNCLEEFEGKICEINKKICPNVCENMGQINQETCECECYPNYTGDRCENLSCDIPDSSICLPYTIDFCSIKEIEMYCPHLCFKCPDIPVNKTCSEELECLNSGKWNSETCECDCLSSTKGRTCETFICEQDPINICDNIDKCVVQEIRDYCPILCGRCQSIGNNSQSSISYVSSSTDVSDTNNTYLDTSTNSVTNDFSEQSSSNPTQNIDITESFSKISDEATDNLNTDHQTQNPDTDLHSSDKITSFDQESTYLTYVTDSDVSKPAQTNQMIVTNDQTNEFSDQEVTNIVTEFDSSKLPDYSLNSDSPSVTAFESSDSDKNPTDSSSDKFTDQTVSNLVTKESSVTDGIDITVDGSDSPSVTAFESSDSDKNPTDSSSDKFTDQTESNLVTKESSGTDGIDITVDVSDSPSITAFESSDSDKNPTDSVSEKFTDINVSEMDQKTSDNWDMLVSESSSGSYIETSENDQSFSHNYINTDISYFNELTTELGCSIDCGNAGVVNTTSCSCDCLPLFTGEFCDQPICGKDPEFCAGYSCAIPLITQLCPKLCGKC